MAKKLRRRNPVKCLRWTVPLIVCTMLFISSYNLRTAMEEMESFPSLNRAKSLPSVTAQRTLSNASIIIEPSSKHQYEKETPDKSVESDLFNPVICDRECRRKREQRTQVDCVALMAGDATAQTQARQYLQLHPHIWRSDADVMASTGNCAQYRKNVFYPSAPRSQEEADYPIAFSIVAHKDVYQLERLLQAIYWPQNFYCIHIDKKAMPSVTIATENIAKCFHNILIPEKRMTVIYGDISRLQADLNCMEELVKYNKTWKYVINLTGQEYPLRTNRELVKILMIFNGLNAIEGLDLVTTEKFSSRFDFHWEQRSNELLRTVRKKTPPPQKITLVKGSAFGVFRREFVEYVLKDELVHEFLFWLSDTWSPDELFWATINSRVHNPMFHAPGHHNILPEKLPNLIKYVSWQYTRDKCHGFYSNFICLFSYGDLPHIISKHHLFANKFSISFDHLVLDCLEQWIYNRTYHNSLPMDYDVYYMSRIVPD